MNPVFLIAEIGINHNGCLETAKKLIKEAKDAGFDAVKFQKRTIDLVYSPEELDKTRESPWGTTNREQKEGLEFKQEDYDAIDEYCKELGIQWSASAWDLKSQEFLRQYDLPFNKVASAMLTCKPLLEKIAEEKKLTYISTGMSTYQEIEDAREIFINTSCPYILMHCNSSYPTENGNCRLNFIREFQNRFHCSVGYSGHERGVQISVAAVAMGARAIERHITLDRTMYGSDQAASLGIKGFNQLVSDIRAVEQALRWSNSRKTVFLEEQGCRDKLSKPYWMTQNEPSNSAR